MKRGMGMRGIFGKQRSPREGAATFLGRLARNTRGNTLAIMAAALIPLTGMVGGGLDMARLYITKTRLQHGCDAGALAGRKQMGAGSWGTDDSDVATAFFRANYNTSGMYGSATPTATFTENAGKVTGTVSAVLPMTLMRVLGKTQETLTVTCDAEMKLPNTDVMFVLDTTGSMNCVAGDTSCPNGNNNNVAATGSKIEGLKTAVKCFYETLAQLDTGASGCTGSPSGGTSSAVQVRFGFVPYASNVNVGRLLRSDWFSDSWNYQTRQRSGTSMAWSGWQYRLANYRWGACDNYANTSTIQYRVSVSNRIYGSYYYCEYEHRYYGPSWTYNSLAVNSAALKNGLGWNTSFTQPINDDGSARTIDWDGCIEERANWGSSPAAFSALPTLNDIRQRPTSDVNTQWHQALPDLIYYRNRLIYGDSNASLNTASTTTNNRYSNNANYSCPTESRLLQEWPDASVFATYVDSFAATGNTYHDIGMLWGARLMWPGGMFDGNIMGPNGTVYAANSLAANGGQIQRHMIFMTDGDATSNPCDYNSNGIPWFDRRQTTDVGDADDCGGNRGALIDQINNRLAALCTLVKNGGITLWVVSYGGGLNTTTETRLETCASPPDSVAAEHYFQATTPADLQAKFAVIAAAISQLRLTR